MAIKYQATVDECMCDESEMQSYVDLMNGLVIACHDGDYREGNRNAIAVDLTVGATMLGFDPVEVMDEFVKAGLIDPLADDEAPRERVIRVQNYERDFDWMWMIDPDEYADIVKERRVDGMPITFCAA